ncbi:hypothetical protein C8Q74DRAFT_974869 [Fomes fomentarius]|nr:hypothetical protein C8Q74DRAFT_974869 [Fomes fomentarius]
MLSLVHDYDVYQADQLSTTVAEEGSRRQGRIVEDVYLTSPMEAVRNSAGAEKPGVRHSMTSFLRLNFSIHFLQILLRRKSFAQVLVFAIYLALFAKGVAAQDDGNKLTMNPIQNLTLCAQTNLTWTGGVPPYRLNVEPFDPISGRAQTSLNQRYLNILDHWFVWTPNITAGTDIQVTVNDATPNGTSGNHQTVRLGADSSCLAVTSSFAPTGLSATSSGTSSAVGGTPSTSATPPTPSVDVVNHGLSAGATAGIAVAVSVSVILLVAVGFWCLLRRRRAVRHDEGALVPLIKPQEIHNPGFDLADFDVDRSVVSPSLSDGSTAIMRERYSGISSTLSKAMSPKPLSQGESQFASYSGPASPTIPELEYGRPTPYLVSRSSDSPSCSVSELRRSRKTVRDTIAGSTNISTTDVRSPTPTQASDVGSSSAGAPVPSPRMIRFETDGGVRLATGDDELPPDALSDGGVSTLPPPYAQYEA